MPGATPTAAPRDDGGGNTIGSELLGDGEPVAESKGYGDDRFRARTWWSASYAGWRRSRCAAAGSADRRLGHAYGPPGQGYGPTLSYPPPSTGSGRTGLIIAGVLGLVVVLGLGVAIGIVVSGGDSESAGTSATARRETGTYSMNAITNACDLVDPTPLTKWSPTPKVLPSIGKRGQPPTEAAA